MNIVRLLVPIGRALQTYGGNTMTKTFARIKVSVRPTTGKYVLKLGKRFFIFKNRPTCHYCLQYVVGKFIGTLFTTLPRPVGYTRVSGIMN